MVDADRGGFPKSKLTCINRIMNLDNEAIREELQVLNLNEKLKDYKNQWKERLEIMSDSILAIQVWKYKPIG